MSSIPRSKIQDPRSSIYIVGPTASGKSDLAMRLAEKFGSNILCADSQTIRRGMDIGTAKPSAADQAQIKHYMLDIIEPYAKFSLADFLKIARPIIAGIHDQGKVAVIVGGTGLYIDALFYQYTLPTISRKNLVAQSFVESKSHGLDIADLSIDELHTIITDKGYQMPTNDQNPRHLINVILRGGRSGVRGEPDSSSIIIGISPDKNLLVKRIDARVEAMFASGFLDEVRELLRLYGEPPREFDAIGYKIAIKHLRGELSLDEAKDLFKLRDRQYSKRQLSWLKRNKHIKWFGSPDEAYESLNS